MSEVCGIVEAFGTAASSCPTTEIVAVQTSRSAGTGSVVLGILYPLILGSAVASSQLTADSYSALRSTAQGSSTASPAIAATEVLGSRARGKSTLVTAYSGSAVASANAVSSIALLDVPQLLSSTAHVTGTLIVDTTAEQTLFSTARAVSYLTLGRQETSTANAAATSTLVLRRDVALVASSEADSGSTVFPTVTPRFVELVSVADAGSAVTADTSHGALLVGTAVAISNVWYRDPNRVAWVLNTESTAVSWYDNFDFESMAQVGSKTLAIGPDGLYLLAETTDSGEPVDASITTGFVDFGTANTKRVDTLYLGYNSSGQLSITAEAHESSYPPYTYHTELVRSRGDVPRANRIVFGKGLWGRYWRMTFRNVDGVTFEVLDMAVDLAVSPRRI